MNSQRIVSQLQNVKHCGDGATARCPAHDDQLNSLKIDETSDRILLYCHAGCSIERICEAMGIGVRDLFLNSSNGRTHNVNGGAPRPGLTLAELAEAKGFTIDFLTQCGVGEEKNAVLFRYLTMSGQRAARQRLRTSLKAGFLWTKGEGHPIPYGLWRLGEARKRGVSESVSGRGRIRLAYSVATWLYRRGNSRREQLRAAPGAAPRRLRSGLYRSRK